MESLVRDMKELVDKALKEGFAEMEIWGRIFEEVEIEDWDEWKNFTTKKSPGR
jgi:hypothetical protein